MPDPLQKLPLELWNWCIQLAIDGQRTGPLEFIMVSRRWQSTLLDSPVLWSRIYLHNEEDELALVSTFLHLSKRSPLHVEIISGLPTTSSLELIAQHSSRIKTVSIRPGASNTMTALYAEQWKRAASFTMASLLNGLLPSDIKHTSCFGNTFRDNGQWFYSVLLMYFTMEIRVHERSHTVHTDLPDVQRSIYLWEEHISSIIRNFINQDSKARTASIHSITQLASYVRLHDAIRVAIPSFVKLLADDDGAIRLATLSVLHELADDANFRGVIGTTIPSLITLLGDFNVAVRSSAVSAVVSLANHAEFCEEIGKAFPVFIMLLDGDHIIQPAIISALTKLADHVELRKEIGTTIPPLVMLLNNYDPGVRSSTVSALAQLAGHVELHKEIGTAIPQLIKLLNNRGFGVQLAAISLLTKLADHIEFRKEIGTAIPRLTTLLNDDDGDVRFSTVSALTKLADYVEICDIIRASISSLDGILEDGYHVHSETNSLLRRLADGFKNKRDDADWFKKDEDGSNEKGEERGDESMDID